MKPGWTGSRDSNRSPEKLNLAGKPPLVGSLQVWAVLEGLKDSLALPDIPEDDDGARWEYAFAEGGLGDTFSYLRDSYLRELLWRVYSETFCMALFLLEPNTENFGLPNLWCGSRSG